MKLHLAVILMLALSLAIGCATTNDQGEISDDLAADATTAEGQQNLGETTEQDLAQNTNQGDQQAAPGQGQQDQNLNQDQTQNPPPEQGGSQGQSAEANPPGNQTSQNDQSPPPPEVAPAPAPEQVPAEPVPESAAAPSEKPARVTALDFNSNLNGGTIIIKTNTPITYTTRKNESTNQFVVELQNTLVPKRFKRPYVTKEFPGPIASINAYQAKGASKAARVVVQLREAVEPAVAQNGRVITITGNGGAAPAEQNVAENGGANPPAPDSGEVAGESAPEGAQNAESAPAESQSNSKNATGESGAEKSLNDFLTGNTKFYGRPINLELRDADIRDALRFIAEESGINIIVGEDVSGKITIKLRQIPWDQALTVILQSKQLGYVKQGNILRIAQLKTIQAEADAARNVIESQRQLQPLRVRLFPVSYAKAEDLELQTKDFLSPRGRAKADKRTNTLVVTDIDEVLSKIKILVEKLDTQTPQVLIEAKVVEARESFTRVVGVNWGTSGQQQTLGTNSSGQTSTVGVATTTIKNPGVAPTGNFFDLSLGAMDVIGDLNATLKLLETENLVKVLSAPRIVALDRTTAKIEQTTQFPVFSTQIVGVGIQSSSVQYQDVKLELTVTPQITVEGGIVMDLNIIRQFPDAPITTTSGAQARAVNSRQATTKVLVENGDTIVIGGIYQSDVTDGEQGIPWLRKIPIIGALFREHNDTREKNELIIFLTPRILNREKAFVRPTGA